MIEHKLTRRQIRQKYGNGTPRYIAAMITHGYMKPRYIGSHTKASAAQMVMSIKNTKPAFRVKVWGATWQRKLAEFELLASGQA